jgi:hypothetical protein
VLAELHTVETAAALNATTYRLRQSEHCDQVIEGCYLCLAARKRGRPQSQRPWSTTSSSASRAIPRVGPELSVRATCRPTPLEGLERGVVTSSE